MSAIPLPAPSARQAAHLLSVRADEILLRRTLARCGLPAPADPGAPTGERERRELLATIVERLRSLTAPGGEDPAERLLCFRLLEHLSGRRPGTV